MVVYSILHHSKEEMSLSYMVHIGVRKDEEEAVVNALTRKLGNRATIRDVVEVMVEAIKGDIEVKYWGWGTLGRSGEKPSVSVDVRALASSTARSPESLVSEMEL